MASKLAIKMVDTVGRHTTFGAYLAAGSTPGDASALRSALSAVTDCGVTGIIVTDIDNADVGTIATAPHNDIEDKLTIYGVGAGGEKMKIEMPAPKPGLFALGERKANLASGLGLALKQALDQNWKTTNGGAVVVTKAIRTRVKVHKGSG